MAEYKSSRSTAEKLLKDRISGILVHPSSLPGGHGIGDLGASSREFVDFLSAAKQKVWQVLPTGPTTKEEYHSPYAGVSAFAGNPLLMSLDTLVKEGLLDRKLLARSSKSLLSSGSLSRVDLKNLPPLKMPLVKMAARSFTGARADAALRTFVSRNHWVAEYAEYAALREHFQRPRQSWPVEVRVKPSGGRKAISRFVSDADIREQVAMQYLFFKQWGELRSYAGSKGVHLFGDIPIYVSNDSADVWGKPQFFAIDRKTGAPTLISGVPPDVYNSNGQLWGHPLYNWQNLQRDGFQWWIDRFEVAQSCFDIVRVDHFRGFESYWATKAGSKTAKTGKWMAAPGRALFQKLTKEMGSLPIFVEDLGLITPPVHALREDFGLMGTRVLQFAFGGDASHSSKSRHHPINIPHNSVVYSATHDNAPIGEWFSDLPGANKDKIRGLLNECSVSQVPDQFVRLAMSVSARMCILLMQDVLGVGKGHRMNYPGVAAWKNWSWRFRDYPKGASARLARLSEIYERNK